MKKVLFGVIAIVVLLAMCVFTADVPVQAKDNIASFEQGAQCDSGVLPLVENEGRGTMRRVRGNQCGECHAKPVMENNGRGTMERRRGVHCGGCHRELLKR